MTDDRQLPIQPDPGPSADPEPGRPAGDPAPGRRSNPPLPPPTRREPPSADPRPRRPEYRGEELDPERGPGLGCFWFQMIVLGFFIVIIPVGLNLNWPFEVLAILLFVVIGLLLLTGQTVIFLLRLVAADRRTAGRRRPLASPTKTVGEMEDELGAAEGEAAGAEGGAADAPAADLAVEPEPMRTPEPAATSLPEASPGPATSSAAEGEPASPDEVAAEKDAAEAEPANKEAEPPDEEAEPADARADEALPAAPEDAAEDPDPAGPEEPDPGVRQ